MVTAAIVLGALLVLIGLYAALRPANKVLPPPRISEPMTGEVRSAAERIQRPVGEQERMLKEAAARAAADAERLKQAREAAEKQARDSVASPGVLSPASAESEAQAATLRDAEEEAKKAAYRAKKAAEDEEKSRKRLERAEADRLEQEAAAAKKVAEEEAARLAAEQAAQAKVQAEAEVRKQVEAQAGKTLFAGLQRTRTEGFMGRLGRLFGGGAALDESVFAELEDVLFTADIGVKTATKLVDAARQKTAKSGAELKAQLKKEILNIVNLPKRQTLSGHTKPHVVMVVGVNGAGKTTTIGKLAAKAADEGKKVVLGAGDTFRAAAAEQLDVWSARANAEIVQGADNADPASVVFDAVKAGVDRGADLVIADTAGRLHTKASLMDELKKVRRVMDKALPGAPHDVLLVIDGTMGQNAIAQAKQFHESVGLTGIVLTKVDGTAKGGVVIGICDELKVPVCWIGVGERIGDLRPFDAAEFVEALFESDEPASQAA